MFESYTADLINFWFYTIIACMVVNLLTVIALWIWMNSIMKNRKYDSTKSYKRFKF